MREIELLFRFICDQILHQLNGVLAREEITTSEPKSSEAREYPRRELIGKLAGIERGGPIYVVGGLS